jgi:small-conductance mechanosensitive channel
MPADQRPGKLKPLRRAAMRVPDESATPTPSHPRREEGEGPPAWLVAITLAIGAGLAWVYQSYLGNLGASATAAATAFAPRALLAAGIVLGAIVLAGIVRMVLRRALPKGKRRRSLGALVRFGIYLVAAIAALSVLAPGQLSALAVSLGLVGFGVTLALQKPLLNAVGWLTINAQGLYGVGDRIKVGEARGDVLHVGLMTTVLWEVEGELGRPTGRRVSFGNHLALEESVVNYSADLPYNWNQVEVPVAKEADWGLAERILLEVADEVVGNARMAARVREYEHAMARSALRYHLPTHPTVSIKMADDESSAVFRLRYLVHLDEQSRTRTALLRRIYQEFRKHPARLPVVYVRNQQMALDRHGMPANAWGPQDQEPVREPEEVEAVRRE